ncbi:unnamed protein product [Pleuronectes platessa]|uniref:Uncharacterized protein n=1 Tax=Pleuronectes platessa TaxID=8262 RepID=A0A9N7TP19_PLEPL|nr:unnamed protein product [Pleuronectes platessa]
MALNPPPPFQKLHYSWHSDDGALCLTDDVGQIRAGGGEEEGPQKLGPNLGALSFLSIGSVVTYALAGQGYTDEFASAQRKQKPSSRDKGKYSFYYPKNMKIPTLTHNHCTLNAKPLGDVREVSS